MNIKKRVYEHKQNIIEGFTKEYSVHRLVYYENTSDIPLASDAGESAAEHGIPREIQDE